MSPYLDVTYLRTCANTHSIVGWTQGELQKGSTWDINCGYLQELHLGGPQECSVDSYHFLRFQNYRRWQHYVLWCMFQSFPFKGLRWLGLMPILAKIFWGFKIMGADNIMCYDAWFQTFPLKGLRWLGLMPILAKGWHCKVGPVRRWRQSGWSHVVAFKLIM